MFYLCFELNIALNCNTDECRWPRCRPGGDEWGGDSLNDDGSCSHYCSRIIDPDRYCGEGSDFEGEHSIDCRNAGKENSSN